MRRQDRLNEIEKLWKSRPRDTDWEQITWEPFTVNGHPFNLKNPEVEKAIDSTSPTSEGYYIWAWGWREDASGTLEWDWALLHLLYSWYSLPEDSDAPCFINEDALAVCITDSGLAERLALLFHHPDSVLLGMEQMKAERAVQEAADKANREANALANPSGRPLSRSASLAFLKE